MSCGCGCKDCGSEEGTTKRFLAETKRVLNSEVFEAKGRGLFDRIFGRRKTKKQKSTKKPPTVVEEVTTDTGDARPTSEGSSPGKADIRCEFRQEMLHDGISLTTRGIEIENNIADAYLPAYPKCYRKATMGFFGGDKCEEGIFWVKVTDAQQKSEMREKAKKMNCDKPEVLEQFGAFDPVNDFLPRYRYPTDSAWSPAYNPAAPYRPLDEQAIAVYPCNYDPKTRVGGE